MYIRKYLPISKKEKVKDIIRNVKAEFKLLLETDAWMDAQNTTKILENLESMKEIIGISKDYFDEEIFEQFPHRHNNQKQDGGNGSLLELYLAHTKLVKDAMYVQLYMKVEDSKLNNFDYISTVNAVYSEEDNALVVPVGMLQSIFYNEYRPMYLNYGALGSIIGSELTHGFYKTESQYNQSGWYSRTKYTFKDLNDCVLKVTQDIESNQNTSKINTTNLEENLIDYIGIKNAYFAYQKWVKQNGKEPRLIGVKYTANQLFWISTMAFECLNSHEETITTHNGYSFRGLASFISTNLDFLKDFNCPKKLKMHPLVKCHVY